MSNSTLVLHKVDYELRVCEVWRRLPLFHFERVPAKNGKLARRVKVRGVYIWVPPSTSEAIGSERYACLVAYGSRRDGKICFPWVVACTKEAEASQIKAAFDVFVGKKGN